MLAHSPPFPLIIDYTDERDALTAEYEEAIVLSLGRRYRIRLAMPVPNLQKLIVAMDEEYPVLECLVLGPSKQDSTALMFPGTLQAPHLRHLTLLGFANPIGSSLFITAVPAVVNNRDPIRPRHTLPHHYPPTRLLAARYSAPTDFTHAPAGDPHNSLCISCPQP
jgi:hypothetical protein